MLEVVSVWVGLIGGIVGIVGGAASICSAVSAARSNGITKDVIKHDKETENVDWYAWPDYERLKFGIRNVGIDTAYDIAVSMADEHAIDWRQYVTASESKKCEARDLIEFTDDEFFTDTLKILRECGQCETAHYLDGTTEYDGMAHSSVTIYISWRDSLGYRHAKKIKVPVD